MPERDIYYNVSELSESLSNLINELNKFPQVTSYDKWRSTGWDSTIQPGIYKHIHIPQRGYEVNNEIKKIQKSLNMKYGSTLLVDGKNGPYTKSATKIAKGIMGLPKDSIITTEFKSKLAKPGIKNPCAYEGLKISRAEGIIIGTENVRKIVNWLRNKNIHCPFEDYFIENLFGLGKVFNISPIHCLVNVCIESAYGTSSIAKKYKNLVGMGITDSIQRRIYYRYLTFEASAVDWYKLISRYIARKQNTEQKLNVASGRHKPEWFPFGEIPFNWRNYATSQTKSMVCGILVQELKQILKSDNDGSVSNWFEPIEFTAQDLIDDMESEGGTGYIVGVDSAVEQSQPEASRETRLRTATEAIRESVRSGSLRPLTRVAPSTRITSAPRRIQNNRPNTDRDNGGV